MSDFARCVCGQEVAVYHRECLALMRTCQWCRGDKVDPRDGRRPCPKCDGLGKVA